MIQPQPDDQFTWLQHGQSCTISDYIYAADWVLCTADSESMLAEVVSAGRLAIVPDHLGKGCRGQGLIAQNNWQQQLAAEQYLVWINAEFLLLNTPANLPSGNQQNLQMQLVAQLSPRLPLDWSK